MQNRRFDALYLIMVPTGDDFDCVVIVEIDKAVFSGDASAPESADVGLQCFRFAYAFIGCTAGRLYDMV